VGKRTVLLGAALVTVFVVIGSLFYQLVSQPMISATSIHFPPLAMATTLGRPQLTLALSLQSSGGDSQSVLRELFGADSGQANGNQVGLLATIVRIFLRFLLAALLAALLAFRRRRHVSVSQRNPYVAQTQILLSVVAAAMMMIVGDSAARAFGIFAAASLVRFRTNIRDPKETTVLLICLGVGLASGVGRWDMAITFALFVLFTLWILEHFEQAQIFRSMEVTVATRNVDKTHEALKQIFSRHSLDCELRELDHEDPEDPMGKIVYFVNLRTSFSTDRLSQEILAADPENIDSVEWEQKKSTTYIYK